MRVSSQASSFAENELSRLAIVAALLLSLSSCSGPPDEKKWGELMGAGENAFRQQKLDEAQNYFQQALSEAEKFGPDNFRIAGTLNDLALIPSAKKDFAKAAELSQRALAIDEKVHGPEHLDVAYDLNNTGTYLDFLGQHQKATPLLERSLKIRRKLLGENDPLVAVTTGNLGENYASLKRNVDAESQFFVVRQIWRNNKRPAEYFVATDQLAQFYLKTGQGKKAEILLKQSIQSEAQAGAPAEIILAYKRKIADYYMQAKQYAQAEKILVSVVNDLRVMGGANDLNMAQTMNTIAVALSKQKKYAQAEPYMKSAIQIVENSPASNQTPLLLKNYADILNKMGRKKEAAAVLKRASGG